MSRFREMNFWYSVSLMYRREDRVFLKSLFESKRQAPGTEWFDTTVEEIEIIVKFVQPAALVTPH